MRFKEIIVESQLNEYGSQYSDYQQVSAKDVKTAKNNFISNFKQQLKLNKKAGDKTDVIGRLANSYMKKYGVSDAAINNKQFQDLVQKAGSETGFLTPALNQLIDQMYLLASTTVQSTNAQPSFGGASTTGTTKPTGGAEQLNPTTKQIVNSIKKYNGVGNLDDLARIAKTAMQVLYKQDPTRYTDLYKEIMSGQTKKSAAGAGAFGQMASNLTQPQGNPNIVRGTNESKRK
jgi:hypothetical protein